MVRETIEQALRDALASLDLPQERIQVEHPTVLSHGDYSTNVALILAKETGKNPRQLAEEISKSIDVGAHAEIEKVDVAGAGFINFHLSDRFFTKSIAAILDTPQDWGKTTLLQGKTVVAEYTNPNPFKEFHIGHLMNNAIGESISRILEHCGGTVVRVNYQGDVGLHVAMSLWGMRAFTEEKVMPELLGKAYAAGARAYKEDESAKSEIIAINKKIYDRSDGAIVELYEEGKRASLQAFEVLYKRLGTTFDHYFFESESGPVGKTLVLEGLAQGIFEKSDGAVIFPGERYGLHTRVFINSEGLPTYEAKELGLARMKYDAYPHDLAVVVTGNEITEYFKVIRKALGLLLPDLAEKIRHVPHGMLRLPSGKMSSRTGEVVTAQALLEEINERVLKKMEDRDAAAVVDAVSVGAIKYAVLKQSSGKDIIFDFESSLSFEGDSGPYLQYANVRALSILEKAREAGVSPSVGETYSGESGEVERLLYRLPEVVERAGSEYEPHYITSYLIDVAGAFNSFYAKEKVLDGTERAAYKLALTQAVQVTLQNGLTLLGIAAPREM